MNREIIREWQAVRLIPFGRVRAADKESLLEFVEEPLQEAVGIMFDKRIPTVGSSCNIHDYTKGFAWISVDYDFMSGHNRRIVNQYEHTDKFTVPYERIGRIVTIAGLKFPIQPHELPSHIGQRAVELAGQFVEQPNFLPPHI